MPKQKPRQVHLQMQKLPSAGLVIARSGEPVVDWDESALVNMALRGLER